MKLSIITPTIGRNTLSRTCMSMDRQSYLDWQHIIAVDGGATDEALRRVVEGIAPLVDRRRAVVNLPKSGDYGHTPRSECWELCDGDYIGYLDDDDYFVTSALDRIVKGLSETNLPTFLIFPCERLGARFFINPPGCSRTTSIQYVHRKTDRNGIPIRFTPGGYNHDGHWLEEMLRTNDYVMYDTLESLVIVDRIGRGLGENLC